MHYMALIRFAGPAGPQLGLIIGDEVAPLDLPLDPGEGVERLLAAGPHGFLERARRGARRVPLAGLDALAPIGRPSKIFAVGLNYADHIAEAGLQAPEVPTIFAKYPNTIRGPFETIERPRVSAELDYEGELAIVIGVRCRHVP